ncbi:MAG: protein kinase [Lachnospiraceae bacterium]|nr:protein kinase [Lachnospiraceae bacterium]
MDMPAGDWDFFDEYEMLRIMGRGARGSVLLVRSRADRELRAVKFFAKEDRAAALHEAEILKDLYHPGIPAFYGLVPIRLRPPYGCGYGLVMAFVPGIPLPTATGGGLLPKTAISYAMQLCEILAYLHGLPEPVLHLDLQPQNILVNEYGRLFLVDFGSSFPMSVASTAPERFGTADFAAPEIYRPGRLDAGADLYSVGMLLYYMLTGMTADMGSPMALGTCFDKLCRTVRERHAGEMLAEIICRLLYPTPLLRCFDAKMLKCMLEQVLIILKQEDGDPRRTAADDLQRSPRTIRLGICGVSAGCGVSHVALALNEVFRRRRSCCPVGSRGECSLQVTDYGVATSDSVRRMCARTDRQILLADMEHWQRGTFRTAAAMLPDSAAFLFNFSDAKQFRSIRSQLTEAEAKRCLRVPYIPDPYNALPETENFVSDVCAMILRESRLDNMHGERRVIGMSR